MDERPAGTRRYPRIPAEYPVMVELIGEPKAGGFGITNVVGLEDAVSKPRNLTG